MAPQGEAGYDPYSVYYYYAGVNHELQDEASIGPYSNYVGMLALTTSCSHQIEGSTQTPETLSNY